MPRQALVVKVDPEWLHTGDKDIDPEVQLKVVDEEWVLDVPLDTDDGSLGARSQGDVVQAVCLRNVKDVVDDLDAIATGELGGLHNPEAALLLLHCSCQLPGLPVR